MPCLVLYVIVAVICWMPLLRLVPTILRPATSDPHQLGIQLSEIGAASAFGMELL